MHMHTYIHILVIFIPAYTHTYIHAHIHTQLLYSIILMNMFLVILMRSYGDAKVAASDEDVIAAEIRKMIVRGRL